MTDKRNFWVSWHGSETPFTLEWPWWVSGYGATGVPTICAAIRAQDEQAAKDLIVTAHDCRPDDLEWRFLEERPADWSPFSGRFPAAPWMRWPDPDFDEVDEASYADLIASGGIVGAP